MFNKYLKLINLTHCKLNSFGFTLFEVTLTLVISTIALVIAGAFVSSSVDIVTQTATESAAINTANTSGGGTSGGGTMFFNILDNDFTNNLGGVNIGTSLTFKILDPNNSTRTINVTYTCQIDATHNLLLRQMDGYAQEILLTNVTNCSASYVTAPAKSPTTITLTTNITVTTNNIPVVLSNVITAQYTK